MMHGTVGYLLTAIGGYWVLERSSERKGNLKKVGGIVGTFIIVASILGFSYALWCGPDGKRGMITCPFSGKAAPANASPMTR